MKHLHAHTRQLILQLIDVFYPLCNKFMPRQTFRYAVCGGANMLLDIFLYFISYNYILHKQVITVGGVPISPHIAAFLIAFIVSFPFGFYLSRYVVWQQTDTPKRVQLFRYFLVVLVCILLNYIFLKLLVEQLGWYPTPSKVATSVIVVAFSYFSQRHFSFRVKNK